MGRMNLGCCSSSGLAPNASAASLAIRLWDRRVPTHPSLSSLSGSCWTSSTNPSPRGRRPRGDTRYEKRPPGIGPGGRLLRLHSVRITHITRSEEHTSELLSPYDLVCRLLLAKNKLQSAA